MKLKVTFATSILVSLLLIPTVLHAQVQVEVYHHSSTALGDILRAKADAIVALRQAELIHERAIAQRLENLIRECDVVYNRLSTRNETQQEHREHEFNEKFDHIKFNQELAEIRNQLEIKVALEHRGVGNLADEMNLLLEKFSQRSFNKHDVAAMQTELSPEQLQAIYLTDGSNIFSAVGSKTHVELLTWPFLMDMAEFESDRKLFEKLYLQAIEESADKGRPRPETVIALLEKKSDLDELITNIKLSSKADLQTTETKWRTEAKNYLKQVTESLNNYSSHNSERLKSYTFSGKTVGDLLEHMIGKGLRFANPRKEDRNLYASVFFSMRLAFKDATPPVGIASELSVPSKEISVDLGSGVKLEMVLIPSGEFMMGGDEHPQRLVTITTPFYLGKYEVTQQQWEAVVGKTPRQFSGATRPVEMVNWEDCQDFLNKLNAKVGERAGKFVLPTEAQWEYACRAASTTRFSYGDDEELLGEYAWYKDNSGGTTHSVGEKRPNDWGLYDMHGNVWEWCQDWHGEYPKGVGKDPDGAATGSFRVIRGGSWLDGAATCRSMDRGWLPPSFLYNNGGFRVARVPAE